MMNTKVETLVFNCKIWVSGCEDRTWMTFNPQNGRITGLGINPVPSLDKYGEVIDLDGCRVFPGFHDSHIHVSNIGEILLTTDLKGCTSIQEMQDRIKAFHHSQPEATWISGWSWEQDILGRFPNKEDLDTVCPDKPVIMARVCGHMYVVNSKALEIAGITKDTPNPDGGIIEHYPDGHPKAGEPNGILAEESAIQLVKKHRIISKAERIAAIKAGLESCIKSGLTAVHSNEGKMWNEYCELAKQDKLPIRVFMACYFTARHSVNFPNPGDSCGPMLSCDRIKLFADGALGAKTAALSRPYKNNADNKGTLIYSQAELNSLIDEANSLGYRLEVHVIGDEAAECTITAMEKAQVAPEKRPILTHCQILREDLIPRMLKLGAIANIQPQFVTTDSRWMQDTLPSELHSWAYAWKSLLDHGVVCAGGSDSPIEPPEPLVGIYDAIYRPHGTRDPDDQKIFRPEECLSVQQAIDLYTKAGAYTARREHDLGQLLPGYMADFVVINKSCDPVVDPKKFATAKVSEVWVSGRRVFSEK